MFLKWLRVPESNATREVEVAQLWEVRWNAVKFDRLFDNERYCQSEPQVETFLAESEAAKFKESLENARTLLRLRGATAVTMSKAR